MISLKDDSGNEYTFDITKFPDGTSQCWHVNPEPNRFTKMSVVWMFENEAEFFHVIQLGYLLKKAFVCEVKLITPFCPFSRQDKDITNNSTFARKPFIHMIYEAGYTDIVTYDAHSKSNFITSVEPKAFLETVSADYDVICFPDKGALERYKHLVPGHMKMISADKIRNQQTGVIDGLELNLYGEKIYSEKMLVWDDLADGGATFIRIAALLKEHNPLQLGLGVAHGIFSKGLDIIYDAGYSHVYTTNSLRKWNAMADKGPGKWHSRFHDKKFQVINILGELK